MQPSYLHFIHIQHLTINYSGMTPVCQSALAPASASAWTSSSYLLHALKYQEKVVGALDNLWCDEEVSVPIHGEIKQMA